MTTAATISARLVLDQSDYNSGLDQAEKRAGTFAATFSSKMQSAGKTAMGIGAGLTAGVTVPIVGMGVAMLNAASDVEESANAVNVVFGEMSSRIFEFGQNSIEQTGMASAEYQQLSAITGAFLKNLGFDLDEAAGWTIELSKRSADMASIFNTDVSQALQAIQSGLKGEFNPLEQFGVKMNMAGINAKVLSMGLVQNEVDLLKLKEAQMKATEAQEAYDKALQRYGDESSEAEKAGLAHAKAQRALEAAMEGSTGEITDNMRAQAALALIMEQTEQFAGDFVNTGDSYANQMRKMKGEVLEMAAALGTELIPMLMEFLPYVREAVEWFKALTPEQRRTLLVFMGIAAILPPIIIIFGALVTAIGAIGTVLAAVTTPVLAVIAVIALLIGALYLLYLAWVNDWGGIQAKAAEAWAYITKVIQLAWNRIQQVISIAMNIIRPLIKAWQSAMSGDWYNFGKNLRDAWDNTWTLITTILETAKDNLISLVATIIQNVISFFTETDWGAVGASVASGIAAGIEAGIQWAIDAAWNLANAVMDTLKGFFEAKSPSKKVQREVTLPIAQALTGLEKFMPKGSLTGSLRSYTSELSGISKGITPPALSPVPVGSNGLVLNNYGTVHLNSPADSRNPDLQRQLRRR